MLILTYLPAFPQSKQSDLNFAHGVESFEAGDYAKAIDFFLIAKELDRKELPPESTRGLYSASWIAHCYYKLGDEAKAKEYDRSQYFLIPPDRRKTVEADRYAEEAYNALADGDLDRALEHAWKCVGIEEEVLGLISGSVAGSYSLIADICFQMKNYDDAIKSVDNALNILKLLGFQNDNMTFRLLQCRVHSYLAQVLTAMTLSDMEQLNDMADFNISEYGDHYPESIVRMLEANIELHRRDYNKAEEVATKAFWILVDLYDPENEDLFDEEFVDSLVVNRKILDFSRIYAVKRSHRGSTGVDGRIRLTTKALKAGQSSVLKTVNRGVAEFAVIAEPGGLLTMTIRDAKGNVLYAETKDNKKGAPMRKAQLKLPENKMTTLFIEIVNHSKSDSSFAFLKN